VKGWCKGLKVVKLCWWGHFLFTCSDNKFCCRIYHLSKMHSITDRQTIVWCH